MHLETPHTTISQDIDEFLGSREHIEVALDGGIQLDISDYRVSQELHNTLILGKRDVANYLIQPTKKPNIHAVSTNRQWPRELLALDDAVYRLSRKINLSSLLKPENSFSEFDAYVRAGSGYNPVFHYNFPDRTKTDMLLESTEKLVLQANALTDTGHPIAPLYREKLDEIRDKIGLVSAYRDEDFAKIREQNHRLF